MNQLLTNRIARSQILIAMAILWFSSAAMGQESAKAISPYESLDGNVVIRGPQVQRPEGQDSKNSAPHVGGEQVVIRDKAFFLGPSKWPHDSIYVCWENPTADDVSERELVEDAVAKTWAANSRLEFKGWGKCEPATSGIRILIADAGPHTKGLGKALAGVKSGMVLNFTYDSWSPACKTMKPSCDKSIAVHEFGHALGFAHEQNRPDTPGECTIAPQGSDGDMMLTPWDPNSVMNYCSPIYNNNGELSHWDIEALQTVYGSPTENE